MNRRASRLILNVALTLAFLASLKPDVTGLAVHEWLGLAMGAALIAHVWLHRRWIAGVTRRLAGPLPARTRLCYALNAALALAFLYLIGSGVWISQAALPLLGLAAAPSLAVAMAHRLSAWAALALLGIKLALHWRWFALALAPRRPSHTVAPTFVSRRALLLGGGAALTLAALAWLRYDGAKTPTIASDPASDDQSGQPQAATPPAAATATAEPVIHERCPFGLVNDPYPGRCLLYVDKDGNGYCDLSETA